MKLSVIIPCYNAVDTIATQLEALSKQQWSESWEVILSDNGSNDNTLSVVDQFKELLPNLRVVDSSDRRGPAHARNVGALAATGDALAFCDADDEVGPGWVEAIGEALFEHDFVASRFDTEKVGTSWIQKSLGQHGQSVGIQQVSYPPYLPHAGGSGLGVKRSLHESVGGFDQSLPRLMDTDYCFRIQLAGTKLHFVPNAVVHVRQRDNLRALFHQRRVWAKYNVLMFKRYRPSDIKIPWTRAWFEYAKNCIYLLIAIPQIRHKKGRLKWVCLLAGQIGRLQGSIQYRVSPV